MKTWWVQAESGNVQLSYVSVDEVRTHDRWNVGRSALCEQEQAFAAGIHVGSAKELYLATRAFVRVCLSEFVSGIQKVSPEQWEFGLGPHGRPEIVGSGNVSLSQPLSVNVAHTRHQLLCGISQDGVVGVDLESRLTHIDLDRMIRKVCAPNEVAQLATLAAIEDKRALFFRFWTLKEAYVKGLGVGTSVSLQSIDFAHDSATIVGNRETPIRVNTSVDIDSDCSRWAFTLDSPQPDLQIAVAFAPHVCSAQRGGFDFGR